ncbi:hypothetical protein FOA43_000387 [Brettanomyces nanus]|uniref:Zn(2)-C6 fungal-type domain-containing protein n=1 Tax=Eeniella nana TaxID=13502 RepID=A0A875RYU1_EENNA|nr:uncharacterized protein FOA43_000387 [Brettanomyces nanus]QPG73082.1 hypothetical protein FOA43_000387 [Brettanomyces nanus]
MSKFGGTKIRNMKGPDPFFPKTRTKTGCFTCRKRKKKCDECYPVCSGCARNFICCIWPENKGDSLPRDFRITSSTASDLQAESGGPGVSSDSASEAVQSTFTISNSLHSVIETDSSVDFSDFNVPINMCSVIPLTSYKYVVPQSANVSCTVPESPDCIMFRVRCTPFASPEASSASLSSSSSVSPVSASGTGSPSFALPLDESFTQLQSVSQMFSSLHDNLRSAKMSWPSNSGSLNDNREALYGSCLRSFLSPSSSSSFGSNSGINSEAEIPPSRIAALREVFYAYGSACIAKKCTSSSPGGGDYYNKIADRQFKKAIELIKYQTKENILGKATKTSSSSSSNDWLLVSLRTMQLVRRSIDLISEKCIMSLSSALCKQSVTVDQSYDSQKAVLTSFLFNYSVGLYFLPKAALSELASPFEIFEQNRDQFSSILFSKSSKLPGSWLYNVITGSIFNCFENLCKLLWLLRQFKTINSRRRTLFLGQVKRDMTLIWTTLQTSEIQLDSMPHVGARSLLMYAKYFHQALEILHIKLSDPLIISTNPVISFYMGQFIHIYQSVVQDEAVASWLKVAPLLIAGCTSKSLENRVFLSKEFHLVARDLDLAFFENVAMEMEERWCVEESGGSTSFDCLLSREGFDHLCN